jgi:adenylosuccinate lyase
MPGSSMLKFVRGIDLGGADYEVRSSLLPHQRNPIQIEPTRALFVNRGLLLVALLLN